MSESLGYDSTHILCGNPVSLKLTINSGGRNRFTNSIQISSLSNPNHIDEVFLELKIFKPTQNFELNELVTQVTRNCFTTQRNPTFYFWVWLSFNLIFFFIYIRPLEKKYLKNLHMYMCKS